MKRLNKQVPQATKLLDHIRELMTRFFVCLVILVISGIVTYFFYEPILTILRSPLNTPLYYSNPAGSFAFVMKICLMGALTVTIPIIIYNLIMFVRPAFKESLPIGRVYSTTAFSVVMAASGAAFAYYCIIPGTLRFFNGFQVSGLQALMSADSYLNFVTSIIITYIIIFQLPLLIVFIDRIKPILPRKMLKMEKWVILGSLIVAALVPFAYDFMTCLFIALPIVVLYNISIILVISQHARIAHKERTKGKVAIAKPELDQEFMTVPNSPLYKIANGLISVSKINAMPVNKARRNVMDIQRVHHRPTTVQSVEWLRDYPQQATARTSQGRIISDIRRVPQVNRALA